MEEKDEKGKPSQENDEREVKKELPGYPLFSARQQSSKINICIISSL
ncbi:MAG: hypothetical protein WC139_10545 [Candidatus Kapaibacterium sp.]